MQIAIYTRRRDDSTMSSIRQLHDIMNHHGIDAIDIDDRLPSTPIDFLLSVGGDGTLLSAVPIIADSGIPVVGINFGHLGFLTTAGRDDMATLVSNLADGDYTIEQRTLLDITYADHHTYALNEVVLHRAIDSEMTRTGVYVGNELVGTYAGNGVIIATPTGSTAYSLSCGGPILTPDCGCFVITPIAAHMLTLRPLIVPDTSSLRLATDPEHTTMHLSIDSRQTTINGGDQIAIHRADYAINLVRLKEQTFLTAIRQKLNWGK